MLSEEIISGYSRDAQCRELLEHFKGDAKQPSAALSSKLSRFSYADGLLWHRISECDHARVVVPNTGDLRERILSEHHDLPHAGHLGREKTYLSVAAHFWWPHLIKWVTHYVKTCERCQRVKPAPHTQAPLHPLPIPADCWSSVSMDFIFGFPPDSARRTGVVVFVDRLSKMLHIAPVRESVTAKETASLFLERVFVHHGLPQSIVSDRDPRFTAHFWRELFQLLGTRLKMSTSDHPQTDGQTERANRVIEDCLRSYCDVYPRQWSSLLPFVEFAINNSVHSSHGHTPFYLNGLRHPRVPSTLLSVNATLVRGGSHSARSYAETSANGADPPVDPQGDPLLRSDAKDFVSLRASVLMHVREKLAEAQERQKYYADRRSRGNVNSLTWVKRFYYRQRTYLHMQSRQCRMEQLSSFLDGLVHFRCLNASGT
jgi:Integrase zinc binding domain/Integrase core domain